MIGIILVVYKQKQNLDVLYNSLALQSYTDYRIYFVDNNQGSDETEYSKNINLKYNLNITYLRPGYNSGFAEGNNLGAQRAIGDSCEYIFFLNNDMEPDKSCLSELVKAIESNISAGAASGLIVFGKPSGKEGLIQEFGAKVKFTSYKIEKYFEGQKLTGIISSLPEKMEVGLVSGGASFLKSEVLKKTGLWEERYFAYGDEIDLAKRIEEAGYKTIVTSSAVLRHNHLWGKDNKQGYYFEYYLIERNKFLFYHKYKMYFPMLLILIEDSIKFPWRLRWFINICDFKLGLYYLKGMLHGLMNKKGKPGFLL